MRKMIVMLAAALLAAAGRPAEPGREAARVGALERGARFLAARQAEDGHFSDAQMPALTALPLWALTGSGLDDALALAGASLGERRRKAAAFVLATQRADGGFYVPKPGRGGSGLGNYNTAVCLSALFEAKLAPVAPLLKAREYIAASQLVGDDTQAGGFGYDRLSRRRAADLSNTSYALDAMARTAALEELRADGRRADLDWERALRFVENLQKQEGEDRGGAAYNERTAQGGVATNRAARVSLRAYGSMSYAAVLSMCAAKLTKADPRVRNALDYCARNWTLDENPGMGVQGLYYYYDILARALAAAGVEAIDLADGGKVPWKDALVAKLVSLQRDDGSWANDNNRFWEADPVLCTSFAMIVLALCR